MLLFLSDRCYPVTAILWGRAKGDEWTYVTAGGNLTRVQTGVGNYSTTAKALNGSEPWPSTRSNLASNLSTPATNTNFTFRAAPSVPRLPDPHCTFKAFYLVWLFLGLVAYLSIFFAISCNLVYHYHQFSWFLAEAMVLLIYSFMLSIASIFGFIFHAPKAATTLGECP